MNSKISVFWDKTRGSTVEVSWGCSFRVAEYAKEKTGKKKLASRGLLDACFLRCLLFYPEDWGEIFFRNVGWFPQTTQLCILYARIFRKYRCENLKSYFRPEECIDCRDNSPSSIPLHKQITLKAILNYNLQYKIRGKLSPRRIKDHALKT
jgi:hypothetical protein